MVLTNQQAACLLVQAGWPADVIPTVVAIGHPESGLETTAVDPIPVDGWHATGWLQVVAYPARAKRWNLLDPLGNAQAALDVYRNQGLAAWATYGDGSYRAALGQVQSDLSSWTPARCGAAASPPSSAASSSPFGLVSAASDFGAKTISGGQVLLGLLVMGAGGLLILSQTRTGAGLASAGKTAVRLAAIIPK